MYILNIFTFTQLLKIFKGGFESGSTYDDILEFDPLTGQWKLVDRMILARRNHAVSVINFEPGLCV